VLVGRRVGSERFGDPFRLLLERISGLTHRQLVERRLAPALLQHMRQFMSDQPSSRPVGWLVLTGVEHEVISDGVCKRVDRSRGFRRALRGVHTHMAEIVTEDRLEVGANRVIQRLACRAQLLAHDRRNQRLAKACRLTLEPPALASLTFIC
jgi:hypothetical protein